MNLVETLRKEIRQSGYLTILQVILCLSKHRPGIDKETLDAVLKSVVCKDIKKIEYTTEDSSSPNPKVLYCYNPFMSTRKKMLQRKRMISARKNKILPRTSN